MLITLKGNKMQIITKIQNLIQNNLGAVMAAQDDLVEVVHTLRQVICVKG